MMKQIFSIGVSLIVGAFLFWTLSPLFLDKEVQDELDPVLEARLEAQRKADEQRAVQETVAQRKVADTEQEIAIEPEIDLETGLVSNGPFPITGTEDHPATGDITIIESPEEKLVYYKNYAGTNGPDLRVYLANDLEANDYVDLGPAKGSQGDIIYGVPLDLNVQEYKYVLTWCEAFGVLFDYATIN